MTLPTPTTAIRGSVLESALRWLNCSLSSSFHVGSNVFLTSIVNHKVLVQRGVLPFIVREVDTLKFAVHHTLTTIDAAVHVIFDHVLLCGTVQDGQLKRIRRTIFYAEPTTRAGGRCIRKDAAITQGRTDPFGRVQLCRRFFEERLYDILKHGTDAHNGFPFNKIVSRSCARTRMLPKRHHSPTVWSMRRRVSRLCSMVIRNSTPRVFTRNGRIPCRPPR